MAITGNFNYNGISVPDAIGQITFIQFRDATQPASTTFSLSLYANPQMLESNNSFTQGAFAFDCDLLADDIWSQCYAYLLNLPEFAGWTSYPPTPDPV